MNPRRGTCLTAAVLAIALLTGAAAPDDRALLDATKAFSITVEDPEAVEGLPETLRELMAHSAREAGQGAATADSGPWRLTLDAPCFLPFMEHSRERELRERVYRAYITRASRGDLDNSKLIERILGLRHEEAQLLG